MLDPLHLAFVKYDCDPCGNDSRWGKALRETTALTHLAAQLCVSPRPLPCWQAVPASAEPCCSLPPLAAPGVTPTCCGHCHTDGCKIGACTHGISCLLHTQDCILLVCGTRLCPDAPRQLSRLQRCSVTCLGRHRSSSRQAANTAASSTHMVRSAHPAHA